MVPATRFVVGVAQLSIVFLCAGSATAGELPPADAALSTEGGPWGTISLLRMAVVRDELKLEKEQVEAIEDLYVDMAGALRRHRLRRRSPSEPEETPAQAQAAAASIMTNHHRLAAEQLSEQQNARLDQLFVRYLGTQAFSHPAVVRELKITSEQLMAIRAASKLPRPKRPELVRLLSAEQQQQFHRLQGAAFEFPQRTPNAVILK